MQCTVIEGAKRDRVEFKGSGVSGALLVAADHFALHARLGLLLSVFAEKIEAQIETTIEALLAEAAPRKAAKKAAKTPVSRRKQPTSATRSD